MTLGMSQMLGHVTQGPCEGVMKGLPTGSVDFILTDPPYLVRYKDRTSQRGPERTTTRVGWSLLSMRCTGC